jgi:ABC-type molybdate transport system substrate-binding protein
VVDGSAETDLAGAFVDYVTSDAGRATLERYGFGGAG